MLGKTSRVNLFFEESWLAFKASKMGIWSCTNQIVQLQWNAEASLAILEISRECLVNYANVASRFDEVNAFSSFTVDGEVS